MPGFPLQRPPGQKPPPGTPWNLANEAGLPAPVGAWLLNDAGGLQAWDSSGNGNHGVLTNGPAWVPGGVTLDTADDRIDVPNIPALTTGAVSIIAGVWRNNVDATRGIAYKGPWGNNWGDWSFHFHTSGVLRFACNTGGTTLTGVGAPAANVSHVLAVTCNAAGIKLYIDGVQDNAGSGAAITTTTNAIGLGRYYATTSTFGLGNTLEWIYIYNQALPLEQIRAITADPFAGWRPSQRLWYGVAAGGAAVAIQVPLGALTLAGLAPTVTAGVGVAAPLGSSGLTGLAPNVAAAASVNAPLGTLTVSGQAHVVTASTLVAVPIGVLSLLGLVPDIVVQEAGNVVIMVPLGQLTLTPQGITVTAQALVQAALGSTTLTGLAPNVAAEASVNAPLGALTLTGLPPRVTAHAGALTFTEFSWMELPERFGWGELVERFGWIDN